MNHPPRPSLKSTTPAPTGPRAAEPARTTPGPRAPKNAARKGAPSAVGSDPHTVTVTGTRPGLTVRGLGRGQVPVADWLCPCGHHERARGRDAVAALTARVIVAICPHQTATTEGRTAA